LARRLGFPQAAMAQIFAVMNAEIARLSL